MGYKKKWQHRIYYVFRVSHKFVIKPMSNDGAVCQRFAAMFGQALERPIKLVH